MLLPFPGALGALEATQRTMLGWMGYAPEGALALSIYVRARDLAFVLAGLLALMVGSRRTARAS